MRNDTIELFICSLQVALLNSFYFFFNDTATTEIYTLSLHDALPILQIETPSWGYGNSGTRFKVFKQLGVPRNTFEKIDEDRKSTRLNSSHANISYAVFCLKKNQNPTIKHLTHNNANIL